MAFNRRYFICTLILLIVEILIGVYVHDRIIRPYIGDVLVVILIYTFVKTFFLISVTNAAIIVLLFSFAVEFLQKINLVKCLNLQDNKLAVIVIGNSFSWIDMICYTISVVLILLVEKFYNKL